MFSPLNPFNSGDKVVAYCRYSEGDDQGLKNTSTDEQEQAIREYCKANSLQLVQVFADPFASGRNVAKRDKYLEMLSFLLHKKHKPDVQGVVLWDYERYGRNYDRAQYDAAQLRMRGYKIFSLQQPIVDNSPFSHVLESMYFASAQNQSDMISADVKRALQSNFTKYKVIPRTNIPDGWIPVKVDMGLYTDGSPRVGYRMEPDPIYKEKIRYAIQERFKGATIADMRQIIGGKIGTDTVKVHNLMKKTLLYGCYTYGGTTIEDYCEPIIEKETWERLQDYNAMTPKRKRSPRNGVYSANRSALSGLLICAECGERMYLDRRKAKGHTYETFYCKNYHKGVRRDFIEPFVIEKCLELLSDGQYKHDAEALKSAILEGLERGIDKSAIESEIVQIDRKLERITEAVLTLDTPPETLTKKMIDLEAEKRKLLKKLEADAPRVNIDRIMETAERIRQRIISILKDENSAPDQVRDAVSIFVAEITVGVASIKLTHGIPGYVNSAEVANNPRQDPKRPSLYKAKTHNDLYTISTVYDDHPYPAKPNPEK